MAAAQTLLKGKETCNILIIGRSGNGKSSIVSSLLDSTAHSFNTPIKTMTYNAEINCNIFYDENKSLKVLDCTGIADCDEDVQTSVQSVSGFARDIVKECDLWGGVAAIVYVLKYGVRYTKQEKDAVARLKEIFGQNVFNDVVIIAFSYGDLFDIDFKDDGVRFEDWCSKQTGDICGLFEEVHSRCVLFNNKSKNEISKQRDHLFQFIMCSHKENFEKFNTINNQMITKKYTSDFLPSICANQTTNIHIVDWNVKSIFICLWKTFSD